MSVIPDARVPIPAGVSLNNPEHPSRLAANATRNTEQDRINQMYDLRKPETTRCLRAKGIESFANRVDQGLISSVTPLTRIAVVAVLLSAYVLWRRCRKS